MFILVLPVGGPSGVFVQGSSARGHDSLQYEICLLYLSFPDGLRCSYCSNNFKR